ncbi:flippase-like domain-containing protein [Candidatus Micrarchaeota archaeon]|nr:flippase-like domain-containing protein [Candidatus Micrarchaeota archaeon]MBU1165851.1 flippase-like domain-containing protein [Candidatus Micrarchaeota archaeon]MBU1887013.1 flippase-like domain-containing protein [Candidatus Micrarchaeota archaeon]
MNQKTKYLLNIIGAFAIILIILYYVGITKVFDVLSKADPIFFILAILAYLGVNAAMSARIYVVLKRLGYKIPFIAALKANFGGMLASDFTPARSGYFLSAFLLSSSNTASNNFGMDSNSTKIKTSIPLDKCMVSIFAPQLFEFLIKILCTVLLVYLVLNNFGVFNGHELQIIVVFIIMIAAILFFIALLFVQGLLEKFALMKKLGPGRKLYHLFYLMRGNSDNLLKEWPSILITTLAAWALKGVEWYLLAASLGIMLGDPLYSLFFFLLFHSFITFTQFLPLPTVAGAGTSEAVSAGILSLYGIPLEIGISFGFLTRAIMILVDAILGSSPILSMLGKEKLQGVLQDIENIEHDAEA